MTPPIALSSLRRTLTWSELWPPMRTGLWVVALFAVGVLLVGQFATPLQLVLSEHPRWGIAAFVASSAIAVLIPVLSNLPLVPLAVLLWGPWWTAALLLFGWVAGAAMSFALGRHARAWILRRFPAVKTTLGDNCHPQNYRYESTGEFHVSPDALTWAVSYVQHRGPRRPTREES